MAESTATLPSWAGQPRRFVCLRQELRDRPHAAGRRLVDCPGYTYQLMVTSVLYAAELVCRMRDGWTVKTASRNAFDGTDAAFRLGCVAYNLLAGFRKTVLPRCWVERRLWAVRDFVVLFEADLIPPAGTTASDPVCIASGRTVGVFELSPEVCPLRRNWTGR